MSGITVTDLLVRLRGDASGAKAAAEEAGSSVRTFGGIALAAGVAAAGLAVAVGTATVKMAGDFQAGMTTLVTGAGESESNIKMVGDAILKMAVDTGTSTKQLTDGMYMIESAGFHGADGLKVLQAAAEGAKVGNADLGTVADATTTLLKDFAGTGLNASQAVNALITTVASGKTHMEDLAASLSHVAPTASAVGISLEDMLAAMATMTGEAVPAADAATYLRQAIIALEAPGKKAKDTLKSIGLTSTEVSDAMKQSLPEALQMITDHLKKKFPEGSAAYVAAIKDIAGGSKQMQAFLDLTGTHMKDFGANALKLGHDVYFGKDSIAGWGDVQKDFNHKIDQSKSVIETLGIKIGTALLPVVGRLFDWFNAQLPKAFDTVTGWLNKAGQGVDYVKTHMDQMRPILAGVAAVIGVALVAAFYSWAAAAWAAAAGVIGATWPVLAIAAAIGLLVAGIVWAYQNWGWFRVAVNAVRDALGWLKDRIGDLLGKIGDFLGWVGRLRDELLVKLHPAIKNVSEKLAELHKWFNDKVLPVLKQLWAYFNANILPILQKVGNFIKDSVVSHLQQLWDIISTKVMPILGKLADGIGKGVGIEFKAFGDTINNVFGFIGNLLGQLGKLKDALGKIKFPSFGGLHLPGMAEGGVSPGGVTLVGERGPELALFPAGTRVIPAAQTSALMQSGNTTGFSSGSGGYGSRQPVIVQNHLYIDGRELAIRLLPHQVQQIRQATGVRS